MNNHHNNDNKTYSLVSKYGQNPLSYLALEKDKQHFFGSKVDGVVAYAIVGRVAVCCGDFICHEDGAAVLLSEFVEYCNRRRYKIVFLSVTEKFVSLYKDAGFKVVKYGEDACMRLDEYGLDGGKMAKLRWKINHANKLGLEVSEYCPKTCRDEKIEDEMNEITKEWLKQKKTGELTFIMGTAGLDQPYDRRYFIAKDPDGNILGFVVFIPYAGGKGYLAEVTRRRSDAPQGVLEKIIFDSFMKFNQEGVEWGNLGTMPLANINAKDEEIKWAANVLCYIYKNFNSLYGFKSLYQAKEKYTPTHRLPRYLVYYPKFTPKLVYSIMRVKNPNGMKDYIKSYFNFKRKAS